MVEKWKLALKEFLKNYEDNDDVIGAILCGSYATGNNNEYSDIDVQLVLKDTCNYSSHGVTESNSYLIEYFINPVSKIKEYMEENYKRNKQTTQNMFGYGKIIYDLEDEVKKLQDLALEYIDKPFETITSKELDLYNYRIWDFFDELKALKKEENPSFNLIYYKLLDKVYEAYCKMQGLPVMPSTRVYKILTDEKFRKNYHVFNLPNEKFTALYLRCYKDSSVDTMYKNMNNLINYYYEIQGGFNIRSFSTEIKLD